MTRKVLGRGLNALLQDVETAPPTASGLEHVALDLIDPNPFQPRRGFPEDTLKELADSIRTTGLVQPVLLRKLEDRYQLIAGERRWRAARLAGLSAIPAVIRPLTDEQALEQALTENLLREDLNPIEVAHAYQSLQENFKLSHELIAERLGLSRTAVTNTMRLLRLPQEIQDLISRGDLTAGHARALLALGTPEAQVHGANVILRNSLSVRQTERWVAEHDKKTSRPDQPSQPPQLDPNIKAALRALEQALATKVKIVGGPDRGRIEITYYSADDLSRIYELIVRER
jgi:ParB family transcriptional regulator, chromosome partitioning protein